MIGACRARRNLVKIDDWSRAMIHLALLLLFPCGPVSSLPAGRDTRRPIRATGYVDYVPGTGLNVILSAPHGGSETPSSIPDRIYGCWDGRRCIWSHMCRKKDTKRCSTTTVKDSNTVELTNELRQALCDRFGRCPATVINLLHRKKLDPNREINEATFGVEEAVDAFNEYQSYLSAEWAAIVGPGLYIDLHAHGHSIQRAELGYLVSGSALDSGNPLNPRTTSIRAVAERVGGDFDALLRSQPSSFGALLEAHGFRAVPSPSDPGPGGWPYFTGGYCTEQYGSRDGGLVDAIQIESPSSFRELPKRKKYVAALVETIARYLAAHY